MSHEAPVPPLPPPPEAQRAQRRWNTAIVVGASSGIGAALVRQLARQGVNVAALARRQSELERLAEECRAFPGRVLALAHDVRDEDHVPALLAQIAEELSPPDLLIYAAGIMSDVGPAEFDTHKDLAMIDVNLCGCIAWCNAAAGLFKSQRRGTIVGISSIAGERGRKPAPAYGTSKAAMNHYLEALRNRLFEHRVRVCTVKPGYVDTAMTQGKPTFWMASADDVARATLGAAARGKNTRWVLRRWGLVGFVLRQIPSVVFRHLNF